MMITPDQREHGLYPESPLEHALRYADLGWRVLPCYWVDAGVCSCSAGRDCKSPGKHPLLPTGLHAASSEAFTLRAWWALWPKANIAIATGAASGVWAVDIDPRKGGDDTWDIRLTTHGGIPNTIMQISGGGGAHYLFRAQPGRTVTCGVDRLGPGVDIKGDGGYLMVAPSSHVQDPYCWDGSSSPLDGVAAADAPEWLYGLIEAPASSQGSCGASAPLDDALLRDILSAIHYIPCEERDMWLKVGMALHSSGAGQQAYGIWCEWSRQSDKFDPKDQQRTWNSFKDKGLAGAGVNTIFHLAQECGWLNTAKRAQPTQPDTMIEVRAAPSPQSVAHDVPTIPQGFIADLFGFIESITARSLPRGNLIAAISGIGTLLNWRFATDTGLRSNGYYITLAPTSAGKEAARDAIKLVYQALDCTQFLAEQVKSGIGLHSAVSRRDGVVLFLWDEIGLTLGGINGSHAGFHQREIMQHLLTLHGASKSFIHGPEAANAELNPALDIDHPHVSLYGTSTEDAFWPALRHEHVTNGLLNRFLIAIEPKRNPPKNPAYLDVPESLKEWKQALERRIAEDPRPPRGNVTKDKAYPIVIPHSREATALLEEFRALIETRLDDRYGSLWGRSWEKASKVSLNYELSRNPFAEEIGADATEWAVQYVTHSERSTIKCISGHVADNDFQSDLKSVQRVFQDAGDRGITSSEMMRDPVFTRLKAIAIKDIMPRLVAGKQIQYGRITSVATRNRYAWVWRGDQGEHWSEEIQDQTQNELVALKKRLDG